MGSKIFYKESVYKDLKKIDKKNRMKIMNKIDKNLSQKSPGGKPLAGDFKGLRSFRSGDYRVIYSLIPGGVLVLRIAHRREVYE